MENNNLTDFIESLKDYTDEYGLIHDTKDKNSGNCALITAYCLMVVKRLKKESPQNPSFYEFVLRVIRGINSLRDKEHQRLFLQHPVHYKTDQTSHDNLIGICAISGMTGFGFAQDIYSLAVSKWRFSDGSKFGWYFPTYPPYQLEFHKRAWIGRNITFRAFVKWVSGNSASPFEWMCFLLDLGVKEFANKEQEDTFLLPLLMIETMHHMKINPFLFSWLRDDFMEDFYSKFPLGVGQCFKEYLLNQDHPLVKYAGLAEFKY